VSYPNAETRACPRDRCATAGESQDADGARIAKGRFAAARRAVLRAEQNAERAWLEVTRCDAAVAAWGATGAGAERQLEALQEDREHAQALAETRQREVVQLRSVASQAAREMRAAPVRAE
jgi:hypothetical protein